MFRTLLLPTLCLSLLCGCDSMPWSKDKKDSKSDKTEKADNPVKMAVAVIRPAGSTTTQPSMPKVMGTVAFSEMPGNQVHVVADLEGLPANTTHGFHIHEKGDLSAPDLSSAGGHFNPDGQHHGGPNDAMHHAGDLGNIQSDANGKAHLDMMLHDVSLGGPNNDILGKSVIVHAGTDDLKTDPSGNSGGRIAGGKIEMK